MVSNLVIRMKDITEEQSIEVRDFLKQKEIKHELYLSAFAAWNMEEAESKLSSLYNGINKWKGVKFNKENESEKEFISNNRELLAKNLSDVDRYDELIDGAIVDLAMDILVENGLVSLTEDTSK